MRTVHKYYYNIAFDVARAIWQGVWSKEKVEILGRVLKDFKSVLVEIFDERSYLDMYNN